MATVVLAAFAGIQLYREHLREKERQRTANARASADAYLLRRILLPWLGPQPRPSHPDEAGWTHHDLNDPDDEESIETRVRARLPERASEIEGRILDLLSLAGETSPKCGAKIRDASVHLLDGIRRFEKFLASERPGDDEFFSWLQGRTNAIRDLRDGVAALEGGVIEPLLLNQEGINRRIRAEQDPFAQFAEEMLKREEERSGLLAAKASSPEPPVVKDVVKRD